MSGHSKWATIKRSKAKTDAARGKVFTKIIREIASAARIGGADPTGNPRLRLAIDKAKAANMPNDNVKRAIDKATGAGALALEELTYEGFGPGGVAIIVEVLTDNRNRAIGEVRNLFEKGGGNLGASGSVAYMFKRKGSISFEKAGLNEESLTMAAIDAGAEDIQTTETMVEVITTPEQFEAVRDALKAKGFIPTDAEVTMVADNNVKVTGEPAQKLMNLINKLEEQDDIQAVHANFDISDEEMEKLQ